MYNVNHVYNKVKSDNFQIPKKKQVYKMRKMVHAMRNLNASELGNDFKKVYPHKSVECSIIPVGVLETEDRGT